MARNLAAGAKEYLSGSWADQRKGRPTQADSAAQPDIGPNALGIYLPSYCLLQGGRIWQRIDGGGGPKANSIHNPGARYEGRGGVY